MTPEELVDIVFWQTENDGLKKLCKYLFDCNSFHLIPDGHKLRDYLLTYLGRIKNFIVCEDHDSGSINGFIIKKKARICNYQSGMITTIWKIYKILLHDLNLYTDDLDKHASSLILICKSITNAVQVEHQEQEHQEQLINGMHVLRTVPLTTTDSSNVFIVPDAIPAFSDYVLYSNHGIESLCIESNEDDINAYSIPLIFYKKNTF